jgi:uncharacterized protein
MARILFWILLGLVAYAAVRWLQRQSQRVTRRPPPRAISEDIVRCEHCGINVPESESVTGRGGRRFCSAEHRRLATGE